MSKKYRKYNKELFNKLWKRLENKNKIKSKLFYFSLFDYMSFEEPGTLKTTEITQKLYNEMIKEIKKTMNNFFHQISEDTFKKAVATDKFTKDILSIEMKNKGFKINPGGQNDLLYNDSIKIEIKRLTTTRQLPSELEIIKKEKEDKKLLLILFFPIFKGDKIERVNDLTKGYYCLEKYYGAKIEICISNKENMKKVIEKILNKLESF